MEIISNLPKRLSIASETTDGAMSKEHVTDLITLKSNFHSHKESNSIHITPAERTGWNGKAPANHASFAVTYGGGTSEVFGHVKLSDVYTSSQGGAANSLGASQNTIYEIYNKMTRLFKLQDADINGWQKCGNAQSSWTDFGGTTYYTYIPDVVANHKYLIKFSDGPICEVTGAILNNGPALVKNTDWYTTKIKTAAKSEITTQTGGIGFTGSGGYTTTGNRAIICMSTLNNSLVTYYYDLTANMLLHF